MGSCVARSSCRFAGNEKRVGVAASRLCLTLSTAIKRLRETSHPLRSCLVPEKWRAFETEANNLLPHLEAAFCMFALGLARAL